MALKNLNLKKFLKWQLYVHYVLISIGLFLLTLFLSPITLTSNTLVNNLVGFVILTVALFFIDTFVHAFLALSTGWDD
jgi:hypothetical protein